MSPKQLARGPRAGAPPKRAPKAPAPASRGSAASCLKEPQSTAGTKPTSTQLVAPPGATPLHIHFAEDTDVDLGAKAGSEWQPTRSNGWLSAPCDCLATCAAALGEAVEAGADQLVGLVILPLGGLVGYFGLANAPGEGATNLANVVMEDASHFSQDHPVLFLALDLGGLCLIALLVLFEADLFRCYQEARIRKHGYEALDDPNASPNTRATSKPVLQRSVTGLRRELRSVTDSSEELELKLMVGSADGGSGADKLALSDELKQQQARRTQLQATLSEVAAGVGATPKQRTREADGCCARLMGSTIMTVLQRAVNGLVTVWLYFADVISDIQVMYLLYQAGTDGWPYGRAFAWLAASFLMLQFVAVYARVLPYLHSTFGGDSALFRAFAFLGLPFGSLLLDCLMFLEPFGLLPIVPLPDSMRQFIPAYKATRIIAEVMIESLPQCLLQSYILVLVYSHISAHTESAGERALLNAQLDGQMFGDILPRSIFISTVTMLKTWIELVHGAREAGISVRTRASQLWNVGHGLPLDALRKGTITQWSCTYVLADGEVPPLFDALKKNSSLSRLNLASAGLEWLARATTKAEEARSGLVLIDAIAASTSALAGLQHLVVLSSSAYEIPIERLRAGGDEALAALRETALLAPGGPWREEVLIMADLLRKNRNVEAGKRDAGSASGVAALLAEAASGKMRKGAWRERVASLMVDGSTRRAHFRSLLDPSALRGVGFGVRELLDVGYAAEELKAGGYLASELKAAGFNAIEMQALGYTARALHDAGIGAIELKGLGYSATELRSATFTATQLRAAKYALAALREAEYPAQELREAGYAVHDLRDVGVSAGELRKAKVATPAEMRDAGYEAAELRSGGFPAKVVHAAGYSAAEARGASFTLEQLKEAGYHPKELRDAGYTAPEMRASFATLEELLWAGFSPAELQAAGFEASELKEFGTSLFQLKQANTPIVTLKEAGYRADRLRMQGYHAEEIWEVYSAKEVKAGGYTSKELHEGCSRRRMPYDAEAVRASGFSIKELHEGGFLAAELGAIGYECEELTTAGYSTRELHDGRFTLALLRAAGHTAGQLRELGLGAMELRRAGYDVGELHVGGYAAAEASAAGYTAVEMKGGGYLTSDLIGIGLGAAELKAIGFAARDLRAVGYGAKELRSHGFSAAELTDAGFAPRQVESVDGRSPQQLRVAGFAAAELLEIGFTASELRGGGYRPKEVREGGYTAEQMVEGGYRHRAVDATDGRSTQALRTQGKYTAKELKAVGFGAGDLRSGGFMAKELKDLDYSPEELKAVGFSATELKGGGFVCKQLAAAGFTLRELREGGFPWKELVIFLRATHAQLADAGYEGLDPKDMIFKQYRPEGK